MKLGNRINLLAIVYFLTFNLCFSEEKITTSPLINVEKIKPSFDELVEENENISLNKNKEKEF